MSLKMDIKHAAGCIIRSQNIGKLIFQGGIVMDKKEVLMEVKHLKKYFKIDAKHILKAVDDVSFSIYRGETLGIVGESGCGKTTCGRTCIGVYQATDGEVLYRGKNIYKMKPAEKRELTKHVQMIFRIHILL